MEDIALGSKLEGTVEKILDRGVLVRLADGINGWIPVEHTADVLPGTTKKKNKGQEIMVWEKRFKEGAKIKCRVFSHRKEI
jgi:ribosomal protein S1